MAHQQLVDYIKKERGKGLHDDVVRAALLEVGWEFDDIEDAFQEVGAEQISQVMQEEQQVPTSPDLTSANQQTETSSEQKNQMQQPKVEVMENLPSTAVGNNSNAQANTENQNLALNQNLSNDGPMDNPNQTMATEAGQQQMADNTMPNLATGAAINVNKDPATVSNLQQNNNTESVNNTPDIQSFVAPESAQTQKKSKKGLVIGLLAFFFLLLAGGGGAAAYYWFVWQHQPEIVMSRMLEAIPEIEKAKYHTTFGMELEFKDPDLLSDSMAGAVLGAAISTEKNIAMDQSQGVVLPEQYQYPPESEVRTLQLEDEPSMDSAILNQQLETMMPEKMSFSFSMDAAEEGSNLDDTKFDLSIDMAAKIPDFAMNFETGFDLKYLPYNAYLQLREFPDFGLIDLTMFKNQWVAFDLKQLVEDYGYQSWDEFKQEMDEMIEEMNQSEDDYQRLMVEYNPITITESQNDEEIFGNPSYHYTFDINEENLRSLIDELLRLSQERRKEKIAEDNPEFAETMDEYESMTDQEWKDFWDTFSQNGQISGEIWIDKVTYYPRQVTINITFVEGEDFPYAGTITTTTSLEIINEDMGIQAPAVFKNWDQVQSEYEQSMEQSMWGRQFASARDSQRRSDLYAVTNAVYQYAVENNGQLPPVINGVPTDIGRNGLNLEQYLVPLYLADIPFDPSTGTAEVTDYVLFTEQGKGVTASASGELVPSITVKR